ncbi:MAG: hypothetical protein PHF86_10545 [Candidatus Nanoarchaeia archaeon]|nr:hypothetical protein [Candidatus Nanoarchaeia archaeon]
MLIKDSKTGQPSTTTTIFIIGSIVCFIKFLFSDMVIFGFHVPAFGGAEFAVALAALGGVYILHKKNERNRDVENETTESAENTESEDKSGTNS